MDNERDNWNKEKAGGEAAPNQTDGRKTMGESVVVAGQPGIPVDTQSDTPPEAASNTPPEAVSDAPDTPPYTVSSTPWAEENQNQTVGDGLWAHAGKRPQERERLGQAGSRIWPGRGAGQSQTGGNGGPDRTYRGGSPVQMHGGAIQDKPGGNGSQGQINSGRTQNIVDGASNTGQRNRAGSQNRVNSTSSPAAYRGQTPPHDTGAQQNRQNYGRKQYEIQYKVEYNKKPEDGLGIASLVLGILSLICCCCSFIGIPFGVLGILFAIMSKTDEPIQGYAKAGLIISIVAISLNVILIILVAVFQIASIMSDLFY